MRIVVDRDLCEANGVCVKLAPDMFAMDDSERLNLLVEHPSPERLERAKTAVRKCPRNALKLVDD